MNGESLQTQAACSELRHQGGRRSTLHWRGWGGAPQRDGKHKKEDTTEIAVGSFGETHGYKQYWKRAANLLQGEKKRERIEWKSSL